jgi:signal transduction histidine kinase
MRGQFGSGQDRGFWLALLFILVAVLAPTAGVLWFMNEAINNQREASRQQLAEAYRGQLALVRDRLDAFWEKRLVDLERRVESMPALAAFASVVGESLADSLIIWKGNAPAYPTPLLPPAASLVEHHPAWNEARSFEPTDVRKAAELYGRIAREAEDAREAARAAQAQVRCLVRLGDRRAALRAIQENFSAGRLAHAADSQGRLIAADEQLLAANLAPSNETLRTLRTVISDYTIPMPSAQRMFLIGELAGLAPSDPEPPTFGAERLAAKFLETDSTPSSGDTALHPTKVPDVWKLEAGHGRIIALYRSPSLLNALGAIVNQSNGSRGLHFGVTPPGAPQPRTDESSPAGSKLPGWRITLTAASRQQVPDLAARRMTSYFWIGFLLVAAMVVLAIIAAQALRRQMRLARLKTDLVAAVSHEIKTPLASMRLLVDALLEDGRPDPQRTREYLEMVARENSRLSRVIDNFLTFSRMDRNRQKFEFKETNPACVVDRAIEAVGERFYGPQCRFDVEIDPGLPAISADEGALVAVLLNLLENAYKFSPDEKHIRLRAFAEPDRVCFSVADNGIGIPRREQRKIFRRFYQVDRRLTRPVGGVGLGLSIVQFVVQAHAGEVTVSSEPGVGSTFIISIPCVTAPEGVAA